jgi:hypothetical protein
VVKDVVRLGARKRAMALCHVPLQRHVILPRSTGERRRPSLIFEIFENGLRRETAVDTALPDPINLAVGHETTSSHDEWRRSAGLVMRKRNRAGRQQPPERSLRERSVGC